MNKTAEEIKAILNNYVIKSPSIGRDVIIADRIDEIVDDLAAAPPPASEGEWYPGKDYQRLFNRISETNGIALNSDMNEIIRIVHEDFPATLPTREQGGEKEKFAIRFSEWLMIQCEYKNHCVWEYQGEEYTQQELIEIFKRTTPLPSPPNQSPIK